MTPRPLSQADPPDPSKIPVQEALGETGVLLICSYLGRKFVSVGYYVNNNYIDPELIETPPEIHQFDKVSKKRLKAVFIAKTDLN